MRADIDMSPRAIAGRVETMRALYKLMIYLKQARVSDAQPVEPKQR